MQEINKRNAYAYDKYSDLFHRVSRNRPIADAIRLKMTKEFRNEK